MMQPRSRGLNQEDLCKYELIAAKLRMPNFTPNLKSAMGNGGEGGKQKWAAAYNIKEACGVDE